MSGHTPWTVEGDWAHRNMAHTIRDALGDMRGKAVMEDDARLFAAAPEMLEALKVLAEYAECDAYLRQRYVWRKVKLAIKRAEGRG